jgi:hypothetical protein
VLDVIVNINEVVMNQEIPSIQMSEEDARMIKSDYMQKIFPSLAVSFFLFLIIFIHSSFSHQFGFVFLTLTILCILIGLFCFALLTKNHRYDLKLKGISLQEEMVEDKVYKIDYEPGSASVPVNMLSIIFLKTILNREMKKVDIYYIIIGGEKVYLTQSDFEKVEIGKQVIVKRTLRTKLFLGVQ